MTEVVPLEIHHADKLLAEPMNYQYVDTLTNKSIINSPFSRTIIVCGEPMVVGGCVEIWRNRGVIWMVFSEKSRIVFLPIFRAMSDILQLWLNDFDRLETYVPTDFLTAHRRAEMFGFHCETPCAKKFFPSGGDASIYVRTR